MLQSTHRMKQVVARRWMLHWSNDILCRQKSTTSSCCIGSLPISTARRKTVSSLPVLVSVDVCMRIHNMPQSMLQNRFSHSCATTRQIVSLHRPLNTMSLSWKQKQTFLGFNQQQQQQQQHNISLYQRQHQRFFTTKPPHPPAVADDERYDYGDTNVDVINYLKETLLSGGGSNNSRLEFLTKNDVHDNQKILHSIIKGIVKLLQPIYGNKMTLVQIQSFGKDGIQELAQSIYHEEQQKSQQQQQQQSDPSKRIKSFIQLQIQIPHHKTSYSVQWRVGQSILDVVTDNNDLLGEYIEGTCGGQMSCCTCHIYIPDTTANGNDNDDSKGNISSTNQYDNTIFSKAIQQIEPIEESELDMLDLAYDRRDNSRLGCQIKLTPTLIQYLHQQDVSVVSVSIPSGVNNVWTD